MKSLVLKDFTILRNNIRTLIIMTAILGALFVVQDSPILAIVMLPMPLLYSPMNRMLYDDEKNNTLRLISTFPIRKEYIVYARYITIGILFIAIILLQLLVGILLMRSGYIQPASNGLTGEWDSLFAMIGAALVPMAFFISIYLPIAFAFGYINAASIMKFIFIGYIILLTALLTLITKISADGSAGRIINSILSFLSGIKPIAALLLAIVISAAMLIISMLVSASLFKRRNLF